MSQQDEIDLLKAKIEQLETELASRSIPSPVLAPVSTEVKPVLMFKTWSGLKAQCINSMRERGKPDEVIREVTSAK